MDSLSLSLARAQRPKGASTMSPIPIPIPIPSIVALLDLGRPVGPRNVAVARSVVVAPRSRVLGWTAVASGPAPSNGRKISIVAHSDPSRVGGIVAQLISPRLGASHA